MPSSVVRLASTGIALAPPVSRVTTRSASRGDRSTQIECPAISGKALADRPADAARGAGDDRGVRHPSALPRCPVPRWTSSPWDPSLSSRCRTQRSTCSLEMFVVDREDVDRQRGFGEFNPCGPCPGDKPCSYRCRPWSVAAQEIVSRNHIDDGLFCGHCQLGQTKCLEQDQANRRPIVTDFSRPEDQTRLVVRIITLDSYDSHARTAPVATSFSISSFAMPSSDRIARLC